MYLLKILKRGRNLHVLWGIGLAIIIIIIIKRENPYLSYIGNTAVGFVMYITIGRKKVFT